MNWLRHWLTPRALHPGLLALGLATAGLDSPAADEPVGPPLGWLGTYRRLVEQIMMGRRLVTHQRAVGRAVDYLEELLKQPGWQSACRRAELLAVQDDLVYLLELIDEQLSAQ